jgi:hypothetical protein
LLGKGGVIMYSMNERRRISLERGISRALKTPANQSHPTDTTEQDAVDTDTTEQDAVEQKIEFNAKKGKHYGK